MVPNSFRVPGVRATVRSSTRSYGAAIAIVFFLIALFYLGSHALLGEIIGVALFVAAAVAAGLALFVGRGR